MTASKLEKLRQQSPGLTRLEALTEYIAAGEQSLRDARALRDEDLRVLAAEHGKSATARMTGLSLTMVKQAVGRR